MNRDELIAGGVYRYSNGGWCRHGTCRTQAVADGRLVAFDTYWNGTQGQIDIAEHLPNFVFLFDLNRSHREVSREDFDTYSEERRLFLPIGGYRERCLVYEDAAPIPERLSDLLRRKINSLESEIEFRIREMCRLAIRLDHVESEIAKTREKEEAGEST